MTHIGERIRQARSAAGLSLRELAARAAPLTRTAIANYENGRDQPRAAELIRLSRALDVRPEFFFRTIRVTLDDPRYWNSSRLAQKARQAVEEWVREHLERYLEVESLFPEGRLAPPVFRRSDVAGVQSPEEIELAASALRRRWDLGTDAIENLSDTLEDKGVRVITIEGPDGFDGFSCWANGSVPVVVGGAGKSWDRQRFDLAHELGELLLKPAEGMDREQAAHHFARAFLVPREAVVQELGRQRSRLDLQELRLLKDEYGLSIQAWVYRARDVGIIGDAAFEELFRRLSAAGMRRHEGTLQRPPERPWRFERLVRQAEAERYITPARAAELLRQVPLPRVRGCGEDQLRQAAAEATGYYETDPEALAWSQFAGDTVDEGGPDEQLSCRSRGRLK